MAQEPDPPQEELVYPDPLDLEQAVGEDPDGKAAWILLETYRWTVLHGEAPYDKVWDNREGYPSTRDVVAAFGSWENLWELAGLYDSYHLRALDAADDEYEQVLEERKALREDRQKAQREASRARKEAERLEDRLREMRRQVERAKEKAEGATDALAAERTRAERAERRAEDAERSAAERPAAAAEPAAPVEEDGREAELREELGGAERFADALTDQLHEAHDRIAEREREIGELRRALGSVGAEGEEPAGEAPPEPATVLEAVELARERCPHLVFAPRALESAADSPFGRPGLISRTSNVSTSWPSAIWRATSAARSRSSPSGSASTGAAGSRSARAPATARSTHSPMKAEPSSSGLTCASARARVPARSPASTSPCTRATPSCPARSSSATSAGTCRTRRPSPPGRDPSGPAARAAACSAGTPA